MNEWTLQSVIDTVDTILSRDCWNNDQLVEIINDANEEFFMNKKLSCLLAEYGDNNDNSDDIIDKFYELVK